MAEGRGGCVKACDTFTRGEEDDGLVLLRLICVAIEVELTDTHVDEHAKPHLVVFDCSPKVIHLKLLVLGARLLILLETTDNSSTILFGEKVAVSGKSWTMKNDMSPKPIVMIPSMMKIHLYTISIGLRLQRREKLTAQPGWPPLPFNLVIAAAISPPKDAKTAAAEKKIA